MLWNNRNVIKTKARNKEHFKTQDLKHNELPFLQIIIDMLTTRPLIGSSTNPRQSKEMGELTNPRRWTRSERRRGRGGAAALGRRGGTGVVERLRLVGEAAWAWWSGWGGGAAC
jgi:hypothetical protein